MAAKKPVENFSCFKEKSLELSERIEDLKKRYSRSIDWQYESSIADLLDDYFQFCFGSSMTGPELDLSRNPYALLAMGDYVYERNCFFPEIKILFLFKEYIPEKAADLIKEILYPLWDIGFKAHSYTRTIKDCFKLASKDSRNFFSIYNSRLICGVSLVYTELHDLLRKKIITYKKSDLLNRKYLNDLKRHEQYSDYKYVLEPDPLNVEGGLADYHSLFIMCKIKYGIQTREDMKYKGLLNGEEYDKLNEALSFLRDLIFRLKVQYEKERMSPEIYSKLSEQVRSETKSFDCTSQWFLRETTRRFNVIKDIYRGMILHINPKNIKKIKKNNSLKEPETHGLKIKGGMLDYNSVGDIIRFPELMILIFRESIKLKIFISPEARKLTKEMSYLLNSRDKKRYLNFLGEILTLTKKSDNHLVDIIGCGILENLMPGFKRIDTVFKNDGIHKIPIDMHIVETVYNLNSFGTIDIKKKDQMVYSVFNGIKDRKMLMWAAFLHHFKEGEESFEIPEVDELIELAFDTPEKLSDICFLIDNAMVFDELTNGKATTKVNDRKDELKKEIVAKEILDSLFLISLADIKSRSSKALTSDKLTRLKELYGDLLS